jgi:putative endonuclease
VNTHNTGRGARYTRSRLPVVLVWSKRVATRSRALSLEATMKQLTRAQKLQWVRQTRQVAITYVTSKPASVLKRPAAR